MVLNHFKLRSPIWYYLKTNWDFLNERYKLPLWHHDVFRNLYHWPYYQHTTVILHWSLCPRTAFVSDTLRVFADEVELCWCVYCDRWKCMVLDTQGHQCSRVMCGSGRWFVLLCFTVFSWIFPVSVHVSKTIISCFMCLLGGKLNSNDESAAVQTFCRRQFTHPWQPSVSGCWIMNISIRLWEN